MWGTTRCTAPRRTRNRIARTYHQRAYLAYTLPFSTPLLASSASLSLPTSARQSSLKESPSPNPQTRPTCCKCRRIADDTVDAHTGTSYGSTQFSTPPYLRLYRAYKSRSATWLRIKTSNARVVCLVGGESRARRGRRGEERRRDCGGLAEGKECTSVVRGMNPVFFLALFSSSGLHLAVLPDPCGSSRHSISTMIVRNHHSVDPSSAPHSPPWS
ncbi:hypothetical protein BDN71DRAFT_234580 [Pleurotus eryngii]|uniref:Uncharacterized protein n=1 Tax=Pleurotus eryngii TaxID=5323 RepID=A0A9P6D2K2_PLEER|nr:hypothetical protein BDN71DRAFT_234580 [Pleurotus eryngii]